MFGRGWERARATVIASQGMDEPGVADAGTPADPQSLLAALDSAHARAQARWRSTNGLRKQGDSAGAARALADGKRFSDDRMRLNDEVKRRRTLEH
jgi:hypothetical protein